MKKATGSQKEQGLAKEASASGGLLERPGQRRQEPNADGAQAIKARFHALRETYLAPIMALIDETLQASSPENSSLITMCHYQLNTGGKRLRALLPLQVAETLGADARLLLPFAAACEMLHNATLVHDDLQDGDMLRRGHPTIWKHFGISQAINLGDAMFYYALLLLERLKVPAGRREAISGRLLRETLRVIHGQEQEFHLKQHPSPTLKQYCEMVEGKTSGLFALPMAGAAVLCEAPAAIVEGLQQAAQHMGVLFQIQDDVLDLYGEKGRGLRGSDLREGKRSILLIHALEQTAMTQDTRLSLLLQRAKDNENTVAVDEAAELLKELGSLKFALEQIEQRQALALAVAELSQHPHLQSLIKAMCELFLEPIVHLYSSVR
jgi:geranylgeranyl pyrophosphate synthase